MAMTGSTLQRRAVILAVLAVVAVVAGAALVARALYATSLRREAASARAARPDDASDPWTAEQTVQPADLMKELGSENRPTVVCVGFHFLYEGGHIPGASFHGPGSKDDGIEDLKKWAQGVPRTANIVLYCGCCPMVRCPNLRPAFSTMREIGFKHVRVLILPQNFATDWVAKGYPIEKGN